MTFVLQINFRGCLALVSVMLLLLCMGCVSDSKSTIVQTHGEPEQTANRTDDSGGPLNPLQALYDVKHIELDLQILPESKSIQGTATLELSVVHSLEEILLNFDSRFTTSDVRVSTEGGISIPSRFKHAQGLLHVFPALELPAQTLVRIEVDYSGIPLEAKKAPWDGGFTWSETKDGHPWIATTVQGEGGDLWFPCKDHPSDKTEAADLKMTVPAPLVVAANGNLVSTVREQEGWITYHWKTQYPISNYNLALSIAPYELVQSDYTCSDGVVMPFQFWVLPESREKAEKVLPEFKRHMAFYERRLGPYPFRNEKYGVVETPHLGMEHQSIIAYGNKFRGGPHGYDWLHHHELGHEWWGNLVTADDWRHFWLHEGLCTYMQVLYAEERQGMMAYHHAMYVDRKRITSKHPLVPKESTSIDIIDDQVGSDVYFKGSWILHSLRYLIGKKDLEKVLRLFAYPDPEMELHREGEAIRFATTQEFISTVSSVTGQDLGWFFDVYLYHAPLPVLTERLEDDQWILDWDVPEGCRFPMPLEIELNGQTTRHSFDNGQLRLDAKSWQGAVLDPQRWILMEERSALLGNPYQETFD